VHVADFDFSAILEAGERPTVLFKGECRKDQLRKVNLLSIESPKRRTRQIYIPIPLSISYNTFQKNDNRK